MNPYTNQFIDETFDQSIDDSLILYTIDQLNTVVRIVLVNLRRSTESIDMKKKYIYSLIMRPALMMN